MPNYTPELLVSRLKRKGVLRDSMIEEALLAVPRHMFLPGVSLKQAYADESIPLKRGASGAVEIASTQPSMTVRMLAQLRLQLGQNVLQLGAGSGYTAALIQYLVGDEGRVTAVEIDPVTAQQAADNLQRTLMGRVTVVQADATLGYSPRANYDRILANASVWDIPDPWVKQLKLNSRLVAPLWLDALQYSAAFTMETQYGLYSDDLFPCAFVPIRGSAQGPRMDVRVGGSSLLLTGDTSRVDDAALHSLLSDPGDIEYLSAPLSDTKTQRNFLPYLMLNLPSEYVFCLYTFVGDQLPYGMNRRGFAVLSRSSASFVSLEGDFKAFIFGGADTFIAADKTFRDWCDAGMPGDEDLHVRLTYHDGDVVAPQSSYRIYPRTDHDVHVWLTDNLKA